MKQTKSQRLFNHAYQEALGAVKRHGSGVVSALSTLYDGGKDGICQRTVNDIRKHAERKLRAIAENEEVGVEYDTHTYDEAREAVSIVLKTCDDWEAIEAHFKRFGR